MNKKDMTIFIDELFKTVKANIMKKVDKYPDEWNGIELRWLIRDHFDLAVFGGYRDKKQKRFKDYKNECLVNNLV